MTRALTGQAAWRSEALGAPREIELSEGVLRVHERGDGAALVLVHGVLTNANVWRDVVPRLAETHRCIALDLPLGAHALPMPGRDRSLRALAEIVVEAIDALGAGPATLVANDTGGAVCQVVAAHHPEVVERLVLTSCEFRDNCPPLLFRPMSVAARLPGGLLAYLTPGRLAPLRRMPLAYGWLAKRPFPREVADSYTLPPLVSGGIRDDLAAFLRSYGRRDTTDAAERLASFDRPVLVAWSREDRVMPPRHGEQLAELLPDARLEWIEDSYTLSPEDQPERVAELVAGFVLPTAGDLGARPARA